MLGPRAPALEGSRRKAARVDGAIHPAARIVAPQRDVRARAQTRSVRESNRM
jgi:hypothetical protein